MTVDSGIIARLQQQARLDHEICGALIGNRATLVHAWPLPNHSPTHHNGYLIPAADVLRIELAAQQRGLQLLGFYHSHPGGSAHPSPADLEAAVPGYVYLIVTTDAARAWRLRDDRSAFDEIELAS